MSTVKSSSENLTLNADGVGSDVVIQNNGTETVRVNSSGHVGIGTSSPLDTFHIAHSGDSSTSFIIGDQVDLTSNTGIYLRSNGIADIRCGTTGTLTFSTGSTERARIDNNGLLVNTTSVSPAFYNVVGSVVLANGFISSNRDGGTTATFGRAQDGTIVTFYSAGTVEGSISVSGSTVSYNGGHLARWSQLADNTRDESIVKGTVMSNLDQMAEWTTDGVTEENEQLNCMKVSDVEGDANVAGVFVNWDNDDDIYTNDMNIAMTGDMVIRIAQGIIVQRGDLLMSAGDGTAKPQGDDIVRSKTIAKVTSTTVSSTYDDGSYLVPCVLMAC